MSAETASALPSNPIFILGSGQRIGSTLVQRILTSHPRVRIWGEQAGAIARILAAVDSQREWATRDGAVGRNEYEMLSHNGFIANMTPRPDDIDDATRALFEAMYAKPAAESGRSVWGFKEVRYGLNEATSLIRLFPGARIVHVIRDPRQVASSVDEWERNRPAVWTRADTEATIAYWRYVASSLLSLDGRLREAVARFRYEDLMLDPDRFVERLAAHCGLEAELIDRDVLSRRIHRDGPKREVPRQLRRWEQLPADLRALVTAGGIPELATAYGYNFASL
jgi:hypothetical protein